MLVATLICVVAYAVHWYRHRGFVFPPDSAQYFRLAEGKRAHVPYSRRWLLPMVLGRRPRLWISVSGCSFVASGLLVYALTRSLACVWLFVWLPGVAFNIRCPVLVDQAAMALMLAAVVLARAGLVVEAGAVVAVAGQVKESSPLFAALLAPALWPFAAGSALLAWGVGAVYGERSGHPKLARPFASARAKHDPLNWRDMLLPWGGVLPLAFCHPPSVTCALALVCAYGQLLIAQDRARLYQWAAPAVLLAVAGYSPAWMPLALAAHPFVCAQGRGA